MKIKSGMAASLERFVYFLLWSNNTFHTLALTVEANDATLLTGRKQLDLVKPFFVVCVLFCWHKATLTRVLHRTCHCCSV